MERIICVAIGYLFGLLQTGYLYGKTQHVDIRKEGKDLMIGFNPKFMIDALKVIDDEEIEMFMVNPKAPCFIKDEKDTYLYLILPVNFNVMIDSIKRERFIDGRIKNKR